MLTAKFHKLTPSGYSQKSPLHMVLKNYVSENPEIKGDRLQYTFDTSSGGEMKLRQFVGEIVYYLTKYGATFLLQEGNNNVGRSVLAGNLMQLFSEKHIQTSVLTPLSFHLSTKGKNILSTYSSLWNKDLIGNSVWNYGDLVPGYLVTALRALL